MRNRKLAALLRDLGSGPQKLPFRDPLEAFAHLEPAERASVRKARAVLDNAWLETRPELALHNAVQKLDPQSRLAIYPCATTGGPHWMVHTITSAQPTDEPVRGQELLPSMRLYELGRRDAFSDLPVSLGPLLAQPPVATVSPLDFVDGILLPNDAFHQLRMVLYSGSLARLFVGMYRRPRDARYGLPHHARLLALRPALQDWSRTATAIGVAPLGDGALATVLENLERPALLVRGQNVVFANRPGMRCLAAVRAWAANRERAPRPGVVTPIAPGGFQLDLVIAHTPTSKHLPPSLRPIVELLAQGLSDKEIATSLNMPLTTVRTYVSRALRKLGVHDRREIIRFMADKNGTA